MNDERVAETAFHLTRRVTGQEAVLPVFEDLVERVRDAAAAAPPGTSLILGGSLARGEPCYRIVDGRAMLLSDCDFVLVHDEPVSPVPYEQISDLLHSHLPDSEFYLLRAEQYARLGTPLGMDAKRDAMCLNQAELPQHELPELTSRDALEIAVFAVNDLFMLGPAAAADSDGLAEAALYRINRVTLNLLRSSIMLNGGYYYHDVEFATPETKALVEDSLSWRDGHLGAKPPQMSSCLLAMDLVFRHHSSDGYLRQHPDAVTGSSFEGRVGSQFVAHYQQLLIELAWEYLAEMAGRKINAGSVAEAQKRVWTSVASRTSGIAQAAFTVDEFCASKLHVFCDQLLHMKL